MGINLNYQKLDCYKNLGQTFKKCLDELAREYGEQLNGLIQTGGSLFTLHDFDHHCYNLYRIISNCLCNMSVSDEDRQRLTEHELFLLDCAVLLHDIGMSAKVNLVINRASHAGRSANFIRNQWENTSSILYSAWNRASLSETDICVLMEIVRAHSNDSQAPDSKQTGIHAPTLQDWMPASSPSGKVRTRLLAGILRMADELDITLDRRGNARLTEQLDPADDDNRFSLNCWEKLSYFSQVEIDPDIRVQLDLVVNDSRVQERIAQSDEDAVLADIWGVREKVLGEWDTIQKEIFQKMEGGHGIIQIEHIRVVSQLPDVTRYIDTRSSRGDLMPEPQETGPIRLERPSTGQQKESSEPVRPEPQKPQSSAENLPSPPKDGAIVLSMPVKEEIDAYVLAEKLAEPGHFIMHRQLCARDWINTAALFQNTKLIEKCIQTIAQHIHKTINLSGTVIVGIDLYGTLLGVRIASVLQCPFAFLVPPQSLKTSGGRDMETELSAYDHVVCVADVVASGLTILEAAKQHRLKDKLSGAYALLYRPPLCAGPSLPLQLPCQLYCVSDTFGIEVVASDKCSWRVNGSCLDCKKIIH